MSAPEVDSILYSWGPGETRLGLVAGGTLVEIVIDRPDLLAGSVVAGRVVEIHAKLDAAFVDIGQERPGFLAKAAGLSQGQAVAVLVKADARGGKGAELAPADMAIPARLRPPVVLQRADVLERVLAAHPGVTRLWVDDRSALASLRGLHPALAERWTDEAPLSRTEFDEAVDAALEPVVALPSGGRLIIEPTAAVVAVDVDGGPSHPAQANREAVKALARALRLRNISGHVVVDFVPTGKGAAYRNADALKKAVADDPTPTHVIGVSPLGLVELTRERRAPSLSELMVERLGRRNAAAVALAALRRLLAEADSRPGARLGLVAASEVAAALHARPQALEEAAIRLGHTVALRAEPGRGFEDIVIEDIRP